MTQLNRQLRATGAMQRSWDRVGGRLLLAFFTLSIAWGQEVFGTVAVLGFVALLGPRGLFAAVRRLLSLPDDRLAGRWRAYVTILKPKARKRTAKRQYRRSTAAGIGGLLTDIYYHCCREVRLFQGGR